MLIASLLTDSLRYAPRCIFPEALWQND